MKSGIAAYEPATGVFTIAASNAIAATGSDVGACEIGSYSPWLTISDLLNIGILAGLTGILIFTIVPLLAYLLIAVAKCVFDLSAGWLTAFVALGIGAFTGLCYIFASSMPPMSTTYDTYPFIVVLLLIANLLIFWSGTMVIDRKLNI